MVQLVGFSVFWQCKQDVKEYSNYFEQFHINLIYFAFKLECILCDKVYYKGR